MSGLARPQVDMPDIPRVSGPPLRKLSGLLEKSEVRIRIEHVWLDVVHVVSVITQELNRVVSILGSLRHDGYLRLGLPGRPGCSWM